MFGTFKQHLAGLTIALLSLPLASAQQDLRIPAFTAYLNPDSHGARLSAKSGITGWLDPNLQVLWFGEFKQAGSLRAKVLLRLPDKKTSRLQLSVAGQGREIVAQSARDGQVTEIDFGSFTVKAPGYQRFCLESLNAPGTPAGDLEALCLSGPATAGAHFNLKERRNAASVHLKYPVEPDVKVGAFYCEMTGVDEPVNTYYMACGWHRGYFGMQVNSLTERRIIFSVWDSGGEAVDRKKVSEEHRVKLVAKGEDVFSGDFGNEGTGGHSHLKYLWKTGEKQRFIVTAKPTDASHTVFSGFYFHPDKKQWMLISSWKAPKEGGYLRGLYSFSENFSGSSGHLRRKALYGNQWLQTAEGAWVELTEARFSHDPTGKEDRLDRFMGVENGQFFLSHGGFVEGSTPYGTAFQRPATGQAPKDLKLPVVKPF